MGFRFIFAVLLLSRCAAASVLAPRENNRDLFLTGGLGAAGALCHILQINENHPLFSSDVKEFIEESVPNVIAGAGVGVLSAVPFLV